MNRRGQWRLSPAYDLTCAHNPNGVWTAGHQMSLSGRTDGFTRDDLVAFAKFADVKPRRAKAMLERIFGAVACWPQYAEQAGLDAALALRARNGFRTGLA